MRTSIKMIVPLLLTIALGGCFSANDMVKVDVPKDMQKRTGSPPKVTLSQYQDVKSEYEDAVKAEASKKASDAAAEARKLTRQTAAVTTKYNDEIAAIQRRASSEISQITADSEEAQAAIASAQSELKAEFDRIIKRSEALEAKANEQADSIRTLVNFGLNNALPSLTAAVPGVGFAAPLVAFLGGLFIRKPGDAAAQAAAVKQAEDRGYDMGASDARRNMREGAITGIIATRADEKPAS